MRVVSTRLRIVLGCVALLAATAAFAATTDVDQAGQRFSKSSVSLAVGDTLRFINQDDVKHNIYVTDPDGNESDKGLQDPGQVIETKFDKAGRFIARCHIHQKMKLTIDVH